MGFGRTTIFFLLSAKATGTAQNSFHSTSPDTPTNETNGAVNPAVANLAVRRRAQPLALVVFH
jgi:hypothetical protein